MTVTNLTPPVISGTARQGWTLSTTDGTWDFDLNYLSYAYQWLRCDAAGANCVDISGATSSSYLLTAADVGSRLRSEVTATENTYTPGGTLRYTPPGYPAYTGYTTINIANNGSNSTQVLNDATDYLIVIDDYVAPSGITIIGGRNVVCIGGRITTTGVSGAADNQGIISWPRNGAYHHFEGIRIRSSPSINGGTNLHDGIVLRHNATYPSNASSRVIFQNMLVGPTCIKIGYTDAQGHADFMQFQSNFPATVKTDKVTALFDYNAIMVSNFIIGGLELHRTNFVAQSAAVGNPNYSGFLFLYRGVANPITFDDVWGAPGPGRTFVSSFYPTSLAASANAGVPPGGDFVTESDCGVGYVSPGYV